MLEKDSIRKIQNYIKVKALERGFKDETLQERLLLLTEELGELLKACRKTMGLHTDIKVKKRDSFIGGELSDILTMLFWTAEGFNIDLEAEYRKKEAKDDKRTWKRIKKLKK